MGAENLETAEEKEERFMTKRDFEQKKLIVKGSAVKLQDEVAKEKHSQNVSSLLEAVKSIRKKKKNND